MAIRRKHGDPRTEAERRADRKVLSAFEAGEFLQVDPSTEAAAIARVEQAYEARRRLAATMGLHLGTLRRARGLSQEQVARLLGTRKSNVSRVESGRYGGMTIERFLAFLEVVGGPFAQGSARISDRALIHEATLEKFKSPMDCLEAA
jgi:DNA-binding transcriptional regulator YiaG